eukprot:1554909-Pyramimonas_sp.AAC.1
MAAGRARTLDELPTMNSMPVSTRRLENGFQSSPRQPSRLARRRHFWPRGSLLAAKAARERAAECALRSSLRLARVASAVEENEFTSLMLTVLPSIF